MKTRICGVCLGFAVLAAALVITAAAPRSGGLAYLDVGYRSRAALVGLQVIRVVPELSVAEVRGNEERLRARSGIRYAHPAERRETVGGPLLAFSATALPFEWQYAATHEDAVPPWVRRAAARVTIAVIDTGADLMAPDLASKSPSGYDVSTGTADVTDTAGHGTFVASLAAGSDSTGAFAGFGGDARLLIVKATGADGTFRDVDEAAAIVYAVRHGARIINLSFSGPRTSPAERSAIRYAVAHGRLVVAAAGNALQTGNPVQYPAALLQPLGSNGTGGSGLAVAASTRNGTAASFSSAGSYVSLAAPGESVFGALSTVAPTTANRRVHLPTDVPGAYGFGSGTSFAAPQVAGAAALVWAADPALTAAGVAAILKHTAGGRGWTPELGYGVIDVAAAVGAATASR